MIEAVVDEDKRLDRPGGRYGTTIRVAASMMKMMMSDSRILRGVVVGGCSMEEILYLFMKKGYNKTEFCIQRLK